MEQRILEFIRRARDENQILERNGAAPQAQARGRLLHDLEEILNAADESLLVPEAAASANVSEETVRRAVRNGEIPDLRTNPRGTMRIRSADVDYLRGKARRRATAAPVPSAVSRLARI